MGNSHCKSEATSKNQKLEQYKKEVSTDHHIIEIDQLCKRLETSIIMGLSKQKASLLRARDGPNMLTPPRRQPEIVKFIKCFVEGFSLLLWIGAFLAFIGAGIQYFQQGDIDTDNMLLGGVLVLIIILTGLFMYAQQRKSSKIMDSFSNMVPQNATVIREGEKITINVKDVVVGDLVEVKLGDRIPADIRIVESIGFKVDNSSITGENEPLLRTNQCTNPEFLETRNIAFFSTNAVEGMARGIVLMCGDNTVMGKIAGLTANLQAAKTPIARELQRFMKIVSGWACFLGIIFGTASICMGYPWIDCALFIIGIIVANVPEGLAATVTVSLTVTAKKMALKNCLVKHLEAVETLGSTSVICSDKTGTLTQNKMTVCHLWYSGQSIKADVSHDQYDSKKYRKSQGFLMLMRCATLCNRAEFKPNQQKKPLNRREILGDASEAAILRFVEVSRAHGSADEYRRKFPKLIEIPFNSTSKNQVSVHFKEKNTCIVVMKGAPEVILDKCISIYMNGETIELTEDLKKNCNTAVLELAARGERVLGFCDLLLKDYPRSFPFEIDPVPNFPTTNMRFVGFISLVDPPRPQVHDAIDKCRSAGIKVIMVTGDHPVTARAIAKEVGIITSDFSDEPIGNVIITTDGEHGRSIVVTGSDLKILTPLELDTILFIYEEIVFARTSPQQKLQIVEGVQRLNKIVAVTGDGVNDAPALKKADIGIAMGITGSAVSHESADMILLDDNFASIITGIEEGRKIFDNLKKSIVYVLTSNVAEITPFLLFVLLNIPLPIGILAILCIDVLTDMMPAISLAYERAESNIMLRPPRNPSRDNLVTFRLYFLAYGHLGVIESFAGFFVYFMIMYEHGFKPERLFGLRALWDTRHINDLKDSYDQEWTYEDRKKLEYTCSTAFMMAVLICQWADIIACKTRTASIVRQGMSNWVLNMSIVVETLEGIFLSYMPYMYYFKFYPIKFRWWLYACPFSAFILLFDEYRKACIRNHPNGYFARETYY